MAPRLRTVLSSACEVASYDSCLHESAVTGGCAQSAALMDSENVQGVFHREQAVIAESNNYSMSA